MDGEAHLASSLQAELNASGKGNGKTGKSKVKLPPPPIGNRGPPSGCKQQNQDHSNSFAVSSRQDELAAASSGNLQIQPLVGPSAAAAIREAIIEKDRADAALLADSAPFVAYTTFGRAPLVPLWRMPVAGDRGQTLDGMSISFDFGEILLLGDLKKRGARLVQTPCDTASLGKDLWTFEMDIPLILYLNFEFRIDSHARYGSVYESLAIQGWVSEDFEGVRSRPIHSRVGSRSCVYSKEFPAGTHVVTGFGKDILPYLFVTVRGPDRVLTLGVPKLSDSGAFEIPCMTLSGEWLESVVGEPSWNIGLLRRSLAKSLNMLSTRIKLISSTGELLEDPELVSSLA